ncbi:xanthine/uracil permease family protein-like protein, partial [Aureobasidium pullulans]
MSWTHKANKAIAQSAFGSLIQHMSRNGSFFFTEVRAGLATFFAMAYIIAVNSSVVSDTGGTCVCPPTSLDACATDITYNLCKQEIRRDLVTATAAISALTSFCMGLFANLPLGLAPGMGINAYFTYTVVGFNGTGLVPYRIALTAVFVEGLLFVALTILGIRQWLARAIPASIKLATGVGIGLYLTIIGFSYSAGIGLITGASSTPLEIAGCSQQYLTENDGLQRLRKRLNKIKAEPMPADGNLLRNIQRQATNQLRKATYPFKCSTLAKLRETVQDLRDNLSLALQALELNVAEQTARTLAKIDLRVDEVIDRLDALNSCILDDALKRWLSPTNPETYLQANLKQWSSQSGNWLLQGKAFEDWIQTPGSIWLTGLPGCGKSVMCAAAIALTQQRRMASRNNLLAYHFHSFSDAETWTLGAVLRNVLHQLHRNQSSSTRRARPRRRLPS